MEKFFFKIGLFGSTGYIGKKVKAAIEANPHMEVFIATRTTHPEFAARTCDAIYNAAGYVGKPNVDACEDDDVEVDLYESNVSFVCRLRDACQRFDVPLLHVSSGCIYQGIPPSGEIPQNGNFNTKGWTEDDRPNFDGSRYVKSKLRGEDSLRWFEKKLVLRPRMPFCSLVDDRNLLVKMKNFKYIVNAWNSITDADEFAKQSCDALVGACLGTVPFGTYNLCHDKPVSNGRILEILQSVGIACLQNQNMVNPVDFNKDMRAQRSFTVLDSSKAKKYGFALQGNIENVILKQAKTLASRL